jgi:hypothetical protein
MIAEYYLKKKQLTINLYKRTIILNYFTLIKKFFSNKNI